MQNLVTGKSSMKDEYLQATTLDWLQSNDYNHFKNQETGVDLYSLVCKRGNKVYATRKSVKMDEMIKLLDENEFDYPIGSSGKYRMTKILFVSMDFDETLFTQETAWASLRSTPIEDTECIHGVINNFDANLSKIFGSHGRLVCKEAQANGYPAPHMIIILDKYVRIRLHNGLKGPSWRIDDPEILRRLGKDPVSRKLAFRDYKKATRINPIWKNGFFDIQGVVKGTELKKHKNSFTYLFKYLIKSLDIEKFPELKKMETIKDSENEGLRTMLYTHLGNKCFRTRDLSFGKGFKERLGLLSTEKKESVHTWKRIRTIPDFIYDHIKDSVLISNVQKLFQNALNLTGIG